MRHITVICDVCRVMGTEEELKPIFVNLSSGLSNFLGNYDVCLNCAEAVRSKTLKLVLRGVKLEKES